MSRIPSPLSSRRLRFLPIAAALLATAAAVATLPIEAGSDRIAPFTIDAPKQPLSDAAAGLNNRG